MEKSTPSKRLLELKTAAVYCDISLKRLRRIILAGELPVVKFGDRTAPWLIDVRDLDALIARNKGTVD